MSTPSCSVRTAEASDTAELLNLMERFNACEGIDWNFERTGSGLSRLLTEKDLGLVLVAEKGTLLGYIVVTFGFDLEFGGRDAFVTELYVLPTNRNQGIAQALLDKAERKARDSGVLALHLQVRPENNSAIGLYKQAGYRLVPRDTFTKEIGE